MKDGLYFTASCPTQWRSPPPGRPRDLHQNCGRARNHLPKPAFPRTAVGLAADPDRMLPKHYASTGDRRATELSSGECGHAPVVAEPGRRELLNQTRSPRTPSALRCSCQRLLSRGVVVLLLLTLFMLRHLLLLVLFLVFLAALVSHPCSSFQQSLDLLRG
jgi:hypothetical protein